MSSSSTKTALNQSDTVNLPTTNDSALHNFNHTLTKRQEQILNAIKVITLERGYPPTIREIGNFAGLSSSSSVAHQLKVLEEHGYIIRNAKRPRAVNFPKGNNITLSAHPIVSNSVSSQELTTHRYLPLLGDIAAGLPISAQQSYDEVISVPEELLGHGTYFLLTVKGDSMINAAICDGDWVVIKKQNTALNGQTVAAIIDGEATIKSFHKGKDGTWLLPQNPSYPPVNGNNATILGIMTALMRKL